MADASVSDGRDQISLLRYETQNLAQDLRKQMRASDQMETSADDIMDSLEAIARDLDQLLAETEERMSAS